MNIRQKIKVLRVKLAAPQHRLGPLLKQVLTGTPLQCLTHTHTHTHTYSDSLHRWNCLSLSLTLTHTESAQSSSQNNFDRFRIGEDKCVQWITTRGVAGSSPSLRSLFFGMNPEWFTKKKLQTLPFITGGSVENAKTRPLIVTTVPGEAV